MTKQLIRGFPLSIAKWSQLSRQLALSPQQTRIVELILCNLSDKEIASHLGLKVPTIRTYLQRTYLRMGVEDRMALVLMILKTSNIRRNTAAYPGVDGDDSDSNDMPKDGLSHYRTDSTVRVQHEH